MTSTFRLGMPTDIPWRRICVTEDSLDRVVCDDKLPAKWQSSIAVFQYVPPEDDQLFPDYDISYLKVTTTITGYQALEDEIQGQIDWDGVDTTTIEGVTELLNSYFPCTGAIVQVVVGPQASGRRTPLEDYPFFLDFEPKKRELYEMATDTKERQSRSAESLSVTKSSGGAESQEVLDVDMGGSASFGMQGSYAGTGGGFNAAASNQGQWGTKSLNTHQSQTDRTRDVGQELRETYSFTTQLSQMYHLLDSYHLGTNRAVFFVQPRPHVLEEPTGFVRGPRKVEGIQEFFLIVAKPKDSREYCVSVRLDTSHLVETDILEYEEKQDITDLASAYAPIPTENDQPANPSVKALWRACFGACWDVRYRCFMTLGVDDVAYPAPAGFSITGWDNLVNESSHGTSAITIAPGSKNLAIHAEAEGHIAIEAGWDVCVDCPDELEKWSGYARRQLQVNLRSDEPTVKTGTQTQLLITTRGLCCCDGADDLGKGVIEVIDIPPQLGGVNVTGPKTHLAAKMSQEAPLTSGRRVAGAEPEGMCDDCAAAAATPEPGGPDAPIAERLMSVRQANAMGDFIKERMVNVARGPDAAEPVPFVYSQPFVRQIAQFARRSRRGRELLDQPLGKEVPRKLADAVAKQVGKKPSELSRRDLLGFRSKDLARLGSLDPADLARAQLSILGVPIKDAPSSGAAKRAKPSRGGGSKRGDDSKRSSSA
jgi:hypothetical protein